MRPEGIGKEQLIPLRSPEDRALGHRVAENDSQGDVAGEGLAVALFPSLGVTDVRIEAVRNVWDVIQAKARGL